MPETVIKKHPVRGLLWGLVFGIGLTFVLVFTTIIELDLTIMIIVALVGTAVGVVWSMYGPAKAPKGPPPVERVVVQQTEPSRFDDFESPAEAAEHAAHHDDAVRIADPPDEPAEPGDADPV